MNAWQLAWQRIRWAARVLLHDLFGENDLKESETMLLGGSILQPIQTYLDGLAPEVARLEERQRVSEAERAVAAAELAALENAIDHALLRGEDEQARRMVREKFQKAKQFEDLTRRWQEQTQITADARQVMERIQERADQTNRQIADLSKRKQDARTLENLAAAHREIDRLLAGLEEELARRKTGQT